jgi:hypothetical protein
MRLPVEKSPQCQSFAGHFTGDAILIGVPMQLAT